MPSHKVHRAIDRIILGKEYPDVHRWMDKPAKYLGPYHRVLRHSVIEVALKYNKDWERFLSAYFHILADEATSKLRRRRR